MKETLFRTEIYPILKGLFIAYILLFLLSLIGSALAFFMELSSRYYHSIAAISLVLALFSGGFFAARAGFNKGWLKGILVGLLASAIMLLISLSEPLSVKSILTNSAYFIISSGIGGICGIK